MIKDVDARRKLVWDIDKALQIDAARPVVYHAKGGTCWWPRVHGIKIARNTIYNHWRFEDVWLDQ
jgi:peptide/nickel transport system substrate-binding protein